MGMFKQFKDLKAMVSEAPDLTAQGTALAANAQAMAASPAAAASQASVLQPTVMAGGAADEPIAGVSIELYATISASFATVGYDQTKGPELAAAHGVAAADWETAVTGWNARMTADPSVAGRFNALYTGR